MSASKTVHVVITHLEPAASAGFLSFLGRLSPETRILCAYGGTRENFEAIDWPDKFFVEDESLRGPVRDQNYTEILLKAFALTSGDTPEYYYFSEYDHFPLAMNYLRELEGLMAATRSDLLGHSVFLANHSNWIHYLRYRNDPAFLKFLASFSRREAPGTLYGMLANGFLMTRQALEGFCALPTHPPVYTEIYIPSVIYHLGFKIHPINALTDSYKFVRYEPAYSVEEVNGLIQAGTRFCHPVKCVDQYHEIYRAVLERGV